MGYVSRGLVDQRRDIRFPTFFRAAIQWEDRVYPVAIVDIANHGLRISGPDLPRVSAAIQVGARGLDERGYVIWSANNHCGVRLLRRISALGVVRSNRFPIQHGHPERYAPNQLPGWLDEQVLADTSSDVAITGSYSATLSAHAPSRFLTRSS